MEWKCTKIRHRSNVVLKLKLIVIAVPASYSWLEWTRHALLVCYSKPGWYFTVLFLILRLMSWASWQIKVVFSSPLCCMACLLVLHSAVFRSEVPLYWFDTVATLKCNILINMQSHGILYNLGIIALTTGINCTRYCLCNYFARCLSNYHRISNNLYKIK